MPSEKYIKEFSRFLNQMYSETLGERIKRGIKASKERKNAEQNHRNSNHTHQTK